MAQIKGTDRVGGTTENTLTIKKRTSGDELIHFDMERDWVFMKYNSGGATALVLKSIVLTKYFMFQNGNGTNILSFIFGDSAASSSMNIGTGTPENSAQINMVSTSKGFLPPRMTTTERDAISSPATGLMLYNTTTNKLQCYNGTTWNDCF